MSCIVIIVAVRRHCEIDGISLSKRNAERVLDPRAVVSLDELPVNEHVIHIDPAKDACTGGVNLGLSQVSDNCRCTVEATRPAPHRPFFDSAVQAVRGKLRDLKE